MPHLLRSRATDYKATWIGRLEAVVYIINRFCRLIVVDVRRFEGCVWVREKVGITVVI